MWSTEQWPCPHRRSMSPAPYSVSRRLLLISSSSGLPRRPGRANGQDRAGRVRWPPFHAGSQPPWCMQTPRQSFSRSTKPMRNGRVSQPLRPRQTARQTLCTVSYWRTIPRPCHAGSDPVEDGGCCSGVGAGFWRGCQGLSGWVSWFKMRLTTAMAVGWSSPASRVGLRSPARMRRMTAASGAQSG